MGLTRGPQFLQSLEVAEMELGTSLGHCIESRYSESEKKEHIRKLSSTHVLKLPDHELITDLSEQGNWITDLPQHRDRIEQSGSEAR